MREFELEGYKVWSAPNPFVNDVSIYVTSKKSHENLKVELYNISGEKVFESKIGANSEVSVSNSKNLKNGVYYIVLSRNKQKLAIKNMLKIK